MVRAKGFSLIEMLAALAIVAVLGVWAAHSYRGYLEKRDWIVAEQYLSDLTAAVQTAALSDAAYPGEPGGEEWARILQGKPLSCAACAAAYAVAPPQNLPYRITLETGGSGRFLQAVPLAQERQTVLLMPVRGRLLYCADEAEAQRRIQTASGCRSR